MASMQSSQRKTRTWKGLGFLLSLGVLSQGLAGCGGSGGGLLTGSPVPTTINATTTPTTTVTTVPTATTTPPPAGTDTSVIQVPDALIFVESTGKSLGILGSGGTSTSLLTFQLKDQLGINIPNKCVKFTIQGSGLGGGEKLNPGAPLTANCGALTDANGLVQTVFRAGTIAGTVNLIAFLDDNDNQRPDDSEIQTTTTLAITGGSPFGNHFGLATADINIPALNVFGITNDVTAFLSDRFTNPVPEGTAVSFQSLDPFTLHPAFAVTGSGVTSATNSSVTVQNETQTPVPSDGFVEVVGVTQGGTDASVTTILEVGPNEFLAGTDSGGIWRTTDGGSNWAQTGKPDTGLFDGFIRELILTPTTGVWAGVPSQIFAATNRGVYRSFTGLNWVQRDGNVRIYNEQALVQACPIAGDPICDGVIVLARAQLKRPPSSYARTLILEGNTPSDDHMIPKDSRFIYWDNQSSPPAAMQNVSVSYDNPNGLPAFPITDLVADPNQVNTLYASLLGGGIYTSTNLGEDWASSQNGLENLTVQDMAFDPNNNVLFAATRGGGVFRTTGAHPSSSGTVWEAINGITTNLSQRLGDFDVTSLEFSPTTNVLIAGTRNSGVYFCSNTTAGTPTWTKSTLQDNPADRMVTRVRAFPQAAPASDDILVLTTADESPDSTFGNVWHVNLPAGTTPTTFRSLPATTATSLPSRFFSDAILPEQQAALPRNGTSHVLLGTRGRALTRLSGATTLPGYTSPATQITDLTGTDPARLSNQLFDGIRILYITDAPDLFRRDEIQGFTTRDGDTFQEFALQDNSTHRWIVTVSDANGHPLPPSASINAAFSSPVDGISSFVTLTFNPRNSSAFGIPTDYVLTVSVDSIPNNGTFAGTIVFSVSATTVGGASLGAGTFPFAAPVISN